MLLIVTSAFAEGQIAKSPVKISGTLISLKNAPNGKVIATITAMKKTYKFILSKEKINSLKLQVGKIITVKGNTIHGITPNSKEVELKVQSIVEKDGIEHKKKENIETALNKETKHGKQHNYEQSGNNQGNY